MLVDQIFHPHKNVIYLFWVFEIEFLLLIVLAVEELTVDQAGLQFTGIHLPYFPSTGIKAVHHHHPPYS